MPAWTCARTSRRPVTVPEVRRLQLIGKPLLFVAATAPLAWLAWRTAGHAGGLGANPVETLQDELGTWALRLLLATLAITPLRRLLGWNRLAQFRRMLGLFAFGYAALHFLNYLWLDQFFDLAAIVEDITERPFITVGFAALLLMLPLASTSTNGWRRRLGRRWQRLHRLVYPVAILACWHFWWQVKKDVTEPLVYAAILALLLGARLWRRPAARAAG